MAQVKYKYPKVQSGRHVARGLVEVASKMLRSLATDEFNDKAEETYAQAFGAVRSALTLMEGKPGFDKDTQVERLTQAREEITLARRFVVATKNADKDATKAQANMYEAIIDTLDAAREHTTATRQFAKDRKDRKDRKVETVDDVIADFAVYVDE